MQKNADFFQRKEDIMNQKINFFEGNKLYRK